MVICGLSACILGVDNKNNNEEKQYIVTEIVELKGGDRITLKEKDSNKSIYIYVEEDKFALNEEVSLTNKELDDLIKSNSE